MLMVLVVRPLSRSTEANLRSAGTKLQWDVTGVAWFVGKISTPKFTHSKGGMVSSVEESAVRTEWRSSKGISHVRCKAVRAVTAPAS